MVQLNYWQKGLVFGLVFSLILTFVMFGTLMYNEIRLQNAGASHVCMMEGGAPCSYQDAVAGIFGFSLIFFLLSCLFLCLGGGLVGYYIHWVERR
ncbi:hypothetical protein JXB02_04185 [Candidatus Woesearchaeota archaeon]|nr:hypothetical protein [Candidatus Woesearchaeota archaeon]